MYWIYNAVLEENSSCKTPRIKHSSAISFYVFYPLFLWYHLIHLNICFQALKFTNVFSHLYLQRINKFEKICWDCETGISGHRLLDLKDLEISWTNPVFVNEFSELPKELNCLMMTQNFLYKMLTSVADCSGKISKSSLFLLVFHFKIHL